MSYLATKGRTNARYSHDFQNSSLCHNRWNAYRKGRLMAAQLLHSVFMDRHTIMGYYWSLAAFLNMDAISTVQVLTSRSLNSRTYGVLYMTSLMCVAFWAMLSLQTWVVAIQMGFIGCFSPETDFGTFQGNWELHYTSDRCWLCSYERDKKSLKFLVGQMVLLFRLLVTSV